ARDSVLGVITLVMAESGRRYAEADVLLAEELALRAAAAIENSRLYSDAQTAIRTREDVLAIVAHDLRNPLGTIAMSANVLAMRLPEDRTTRGGLRRQIEIIHRAADRMERLIGDLLDMASVQAGRLSITLDTVDLGALLEEAFEMHEPLAMEAGVVLRKELDLEGLQARCDRGRMLQALANLLGNAIKFCSPGDTVSLHGARRGAELEIAIADTGRGIERDDFDKIFQPYMAIRQEGKRGTGLGLYITKGIIEAHGGRLTFESEVASGTTFYLSLPLMDGRALE
ncbi:MAG TPA: HAMP domain-containing sensor histidine kinase, partial [Gammaproteobacteria bacterium]|nr:HAMP domain-containing sensor histidine kinase [Gammaproteobacteria bacterium]